MDRRIISGNFFYDRDFWSEDISIEGDIEPLLRGTDEENLQRLTEFNRDLERRARYSYWQIDYQREVDGKYILRCQRYYKR